MKEPRISVAREENIYLTISLQLHILVFDILCQHFCDFYLISQRISSDHPPSAATNFPMHSELET